MPRGPRHAVEPSEVVEVPVHRAAVDPSLDEVAAALGAVGFHVDRETARFSWTTPGAEALLGVPADEWRKADFLAERVHPADRERVRASIMRGDAGVGWRFLAKNGSVVWVEARMWGASPTRGLLLDVTRQRNAERRLAVQQATTGILALSESVDVALPALLHAIADTMGWAAGVYWRLQGERLVVGSAWFPPGVDVAPIVGVTRSLSFAPGEGLPGRVFVSGHAAWVIDLPHADLPRSPVAAASGIRSIVGLPIRGPSGVHGVLEFWSRDALDEDAEILAVLEAVGIQIGLFVERRAAERALRESDARKGAILEASLDGILVVDTEQRVVSVNGPFEAMWGEAHALSPVDGGGMMRALASLVEDADQFLRGVQSIEERPDARVRDEVRTKDGRVLERHGTGIASPVGERSGVVWSFRDVTSRRRNEETLARLLREVDLQRARLDAIIRSVPGVVWEAWGEPDAASQRIDFVSDHVETMLGYSTREWLETPNFWLGLVHPEDRERAASESLKHFLSGQGGTLQFRWRRKDGRYIWAQAWNRVIVDADGKPVGMRGVTLDITARKEAEQEAERVRDRFQQILQHAGEGIYGVDEHGATTFMNDAALRMTGLTAEEAVGRKLHDIIHHTKANGARYQAPECPIYKAAHGAPTAYCSEEIFWRVDGTSFPVEYVTSPIRHDGRVLGAVTVFKDVSERRKAELAFERERRLLSTIIEQMPAGVLIIDVDSGRLLLANAHVNAILGHDFIPAEGMAQYHEYRVLRLDGTVMPPDEYPLARALAAGTAVTGEELIYERKDGARVRLLVNAAPVHDAEGRMVAGIATFIDVTDRARTLVALREKDERLRAALAASATGTFRWDVATGTLEWDENLDRLFGLLPGETPRHLDQFTSFVHPDDRASVLAAIERSVTQGADLDLEFRVLWPDGSVHWVLDRGRMVRDEAGRPSYMTGACVDVTVRKRAEEDLRRNADLLGWQRRVLETIARSAPLHETLDILCREAEAQTTGHHFSVLLVDEDGKRLRHGAAPSLPAHYNSAVDGIPIGEGVGSCGTAAFRQEAVLVRDIATDPLWKDFKGLALPIGLRSCWSTPIYGSDGRLIGTWAVYRDVAGDPEPGDALIVSIATRLASVAIERARIEDAVRHQRDLTKAITDNTGAALFMMDLAGHPVFLNPAALAMTGYASLDEVKDRPLHESVHFRKGDGSPYPIEECPIDRANAEVRPLRGQREVFCRKDGSLFPVEYNVAPVQRDGLPAGVVIEVRDITEELRAEQQLRERADELQRLAEALARSNHELDQFAYVTSHDLKAPLRGIANLSRWIEEDVGPVLTPEARGHLDLLRGRVNRMESLIDAILEFSRAGRVRGKPERVDTGELVKDVLDLLSPSPAFTIEVQEDMPTLVVDRTRLQQVFQNLIGNALKHHGRPEGRVGITWHDMGDRVRFSVADDGPGIDPRFHDRIFVIFQTLQARDKVEGTGVGLALVKKIVESYGGTIRLDSEEGKGATFHFTWPKVTKGD